MQSRCEVASLPANLWVSCVKSRKNVAVTPPRVRICQLTPCLWSGGTEERIARVTRAMNRQEFEVAWMGFGPVREALVERAGPGLEVYPIARNPAGGIEPSVVARIAGFLARFRPDVLHVHNWSTSLYGIAAARLAQVPRVLFGMGGREVNQGAGERRQRAMRVLAPHVDRFTAVCDFLGRDLQRDFDVPAERVSVLKTGVDVGRIDDARGGADARRWLDIPQDALVVGAISVFRPVKRIPDLIDAVGAIARTRPDIHLLLVGNPVRMTVEEIRQRARTAGLGDRIHLPGRLEDPPSVLKAFDIFVNCSVFEGSSNAIIEAMAARLPVVGTAVGGTPELVIPGETGFLVEPKDVDGLSNAISTLAEDRDLRSRMGQAGRDRTLELHTEEKMIETYLDLYRREASTGRASGRMQLGLQNTARLMRSLRAAVV